MAAQVDEADVTRGELEECLQHLLAHARRQQHITARFSTDKPTAWDRAHAQIDYVLFDLLGR